MKATAKCMVRLPREVAHRILDDVDAYRVLQMGASLEGDEARMYRDMLLTFRRRRNFLPDEDQIICMLELYKLSQQLDKIIRAKEGPMNSPLAMNMSHYRKLTATDRNIVMRQQREWLARKIDDQLQMINFESDIDMAALLHHIPMKSNWHIDRGVVQRLRKHWLNIEVKRTGSKGRAKQRMEQILRMREIFVRYPKYLKLSSDPGTDYRPNWLQIVKIFVRAARMLEKNIKKDWCRNRPSYLFRKRHFPLVPLDSLLEMFISTLIKHPLPGVVISAEATMLSDLQSLTLSEALHDVRPLNYPEPIRKDIQTVLLSLAYVYTKPSNGRFERVIRTKVTPYSAPPYNLYDESKLRTPLFTAPTYSHLNHVLGYGYAYTEIGVDPTAGKIDKLTLQYHLELHTKPVARFSRRRSGVRYEADKPDETDWYHEKEFEWLEAFLRVVDWMKRELFDDNRHEDENDSHYEWETWDSLWGI